MWPQGTKLQLPRLQRLETITVSFVINFGKWGGFYVHRGNTIRVCLGWVAFTAMKGDIDEVLARLDREGKL
jgi:hypothetical protein